MLSKNIIKLREENNLTRSELARRTGLSARIIEYIEFEKSNNPTLHTLQSLAKAFDITIDELIK